MSLFTNPLSTAYGSITGGNIDEEAAQQMASKGAGAAKEYAYQEAIKLQK
jgi:hypothetical protein